VSLPTREDLARWARWTISTRPLLGRFLGWLGLRALEKHSGHPDVVFPLVQALDSPHPDLAARAEAILRALPDPAAVDALCGLWARSREPRLARILESCGYTAREPLEVQVLSCLAVARLEEMVGTDGAEIPALVAALEDRDPVIRSRAEQVLRGVTRPGAIDGMIDLVLAGEGGEPLVRLIEEAGHQHSLEGRTFMYLVLVGRMDDYLGADHEFQVLRPEFQAAPPELQARLREAIVHSGNVRMNGLFVVPRREKTLADLTDEDADLLVRVNARNRNWDALFRFLWVLPARHIARAVQAMLAASYQPEEPDRARLLKELADLLVEIGGIPEGKVGRPPLGPVLEGWLAGGETPEQSGRTDEDLRRVLARPTNPADQVLALGGLLRRQSLQPADLEVAGSSPHWPVRFVAAALGGRVETNHEGASLWLGRVAPVYAADRVWGGKPCELKREGLEALQEVLVTLPDRRAAGGLLLLEAVSAHYTAHDIEVEVGAHVVLDEDAFEIDG
jgi:hypothetical protein